MQPKVFHFHQIWEHNQIKRPQIKVETPMTDNDPITDK